VIKINQSSRERANANERRINLMNLFFRENERNIEENKEIAKAIDKEITRLTGREYNHTAINNRAMYATRSDPRAALGKYDPLAEISDAIFRDALLSSRRHRGYESSLQIVFAMKKVNSTRIHAHTIDKRIYEPLEKVVSSISIVDSDVIYPTGGEDTEGSGREEKKGIKGKLSFKKPKNRTE